ncbi:hypothetical protein ACSBR2_016973 [Camellia fascicularis]
MEQMSKRRLKSSNWAGHICLKMEKKLGAEYQSSRAWIVNGFSCSQAKVAFRNSGKNIYNLIESYHHVSQFRASYSESIHPIPTIEKPTVKPNDYLIAPPAVKRLTGRPKQKRIPSKGEVVQRIRCSRYRKMGNHNRKTCKEPI